MKVVINRCFGGFCLSDKAVEMIMKRKGFDCFRYARTKYEFSDGVDEFERREDNHGDKMFPLIYYSVKNLGEKVSELPDDVVWDNDNINRDDTDLIAVVEELGKEASSRVSNLVVVEIPDDVSWTIQDYDGVESIHEAHRIWTK